MTSAPCQTGQAMKIVLSICDSKTGKPRQAWKCQKWHWNNENGRGVELLPIPSIRNLVAQIPLTSYKIAKLRIMT
jgi:hypothetical protein